MRTLVAVVGLVLATAFLLPGAADPRAAVPDDSEAAPGETAKRPQMALETEHGGS